MPNRRDFMKSAALLAGAAQLPQERATAQKSGENFAAFQAERRNLLWSLLGDLPEKRAPKATLK